VVVIRRLEVSDHADLRALRLRALEAEPTAFGSTLERELHFGESVWRDRLDPKGHPHFGAFRVGTDLVGLVVAVADVGDSTVVNLVGMWIDQRDRGAGLAEELIGEVVRWAFEQRATMVRLFVTEGNTRAESVYRRVGFSRTGQTEIRSRDDATEVEMQLRIPHNDRFAAANF
jgi:RimJ/RimL family protein N-acetyltransferase